MSYTVQFLLYTSFFISFLTVINKSINSIQCREFKYQKSLNQTLKRTVDKQLNISTSLFLLTPTCVLEKNSALNFQLYGKLSHE
jgi:hypothetical protein